MWDITGPKVAMHSTTACNLRIMRQKSLTQHFEKLIQSGTGMIGHVVDLIDRGGIFNRGRQEICLNHVCDIAEVTARGAITVHIDALPPHYRRDPARND